MNGLDVGAGRGSRTPKTRRSADFETADKRIPDSWKCLKMRVWSSGVGGLAEKKKKVGDGIFRFSLGLVGYILSYIFARTSEIPAGAVREDFSVGTKCKTVTA